MKAIMQPSPQLDISQIHSTAQRIHDQVGQVIVGKADVIDLLLVALFCEGHVLLEDVPGIGKTMLAKAMARSLGCSFRRIQFTPDVLPSDITGVNVFNQKAGDFEYRPVRWPPDRADRRDQPRRSTHPVVAARSDGRASGHRGWRHPRLALPVFRTGYPEPGGVGRHLSPARGAADRFLLRVALGYPEQRRSA